MRLSTLFGPDFRQILREEPTALRDALDELHEEDVAEICEELSEEEVVNLLRALPDDFAGGVLERLPDELRNKALEQLKPTEAATLLAEMAPDDRADALQSLEMPLQEKLLAELETVEPEAAEEARELVAYPEDSAGAIMTTKFVGIPPETKVWQAIDGVRKASKTGNVETVYYVYALAYGDKLVGVVSLRELILAEPAQTLADVMTQNVVRLDVADGREDVARTMAKYDFNAMPVVDAAGKMVGVVTVDDVVDVVIEAATEDAHKMGAVAPMEESYFQVSFWQYWRSRVTWLVVLFLGGFLTASVMEHFEGDIRELAVLAVFLPLIISTGGNAGSQSASLVIRALATDEVHPRDWLRVLKRELLVGISLGLVVGALGFARALFTADTTDAAAFAAVVSVSIIGVVTVGSLVGALLPLVIQRVGLDPAVSSTPFIASLSDVVGLLIYLGIARTLLGLE
jgi:magnesium transporter